MARILFIVYLAGTSFALTYYLLGGYMATYGLPWRPGRTSPLTETFNRDRWQMLWLTLLAVVTVNVVFLGPWLVVFHRLF
ncbi:MAG: hypothetical protein HY657_05385 [Acidobacteria bacterium]|nr:hypothetical protein [Acidobacteriota bacterium]